MSATHLHAPRCTRSAALLMHRPLVTKVAGMMRKRMPANVEMDDIMQAGLLGLSQALAGFSATGGAAFDTYAFRRIQGAMLDELRETDHLSRTVRSQMRQVRKAVQHLENELLRAPRAMEVAEHLGWALKAVHDTMVAAGAPGKRLGDPEFDEAENEASLAVRQGDEVGLFGADDFADPALHMQRNQEHAAVNTAYSELGDRDRMLLDLMYKDDMSQQEIAAMWGVSVSRICQLHATAVARLRERVTRPSGHTSQAVAMPVLPPRQNPRGKRMALAPAAAPAARSDFIERRLSTTLGATRVTAPAHDLTLAGDPGHACDWLDRAAQECLV